MPTFETNNTGFTLIELLVVLLIMGVATSMITISTNILPETKTSQSRIIQKQFNQAKQEVILLNQSIRLRIKEPNTIIAESFDPLTAKWKLNTRINPLMFEANKIHMESEFLIIRPNGRITQTTINFNDGQTIIDTR